MGFCRSNGAFGSNVANGLIEPFVWHLERSVSRGRNVCRSPVRNVWIFDLEGALLRCRKPTASVSETHWFGRENPLVRAGFAPSSISLFYLQSYEKFLTWPNVFTLYFTVSAPFCWWVVDKYCTPNFVIINRRCDFAFGYKKTSIFSLTKIFTYLLIYLYIIYILYIMYYIE